MIIDSWMELEIGKIYSNAHGWFELNNEEFKGPFKFFVIRKATEQEYHEENIRDYGKSFPIVYGNIYQISID